MPIGVNAIRLADDVRERDLIETRPFKIQHFDVLPFREVAGGRDLYTRTNQFVDFGVNLDNCAKIEEQTPLPDTEVRYEFVLLGTMFRVCYTAQDRFRVPNNIVQIVKRLATRRLRYKFSRIMDTGDGAFPSLESLAGTVIPVGGALTLTNLDDAWLSVHENDGHANAIFCNSDGLKAIWEAHYARSINPSYEPERFPDPIEGMRASLRPCLHGVRIYVNDLIETRLQPDGSFLTNIYFALVGDSGRNEGRGLTAIIPPMQGGDMFTFRMTPVVTDTVSLSTINVDATWPVGLSIGSPSALSMLKDVQVIPVPG